MLDLILALFAAPVVAAPGDVLIAAGGELGDVPVVRPLPDQFVVSRAPDLTRVDFVPTRRPLALAPPLADVLLPLDGQGLPERTVRPLGAGREAVGADGDVGR